MNAKHTPGPWTVHPDKLSGDGRAICSLSHPQQLSVAWTTAVRTGLPPGQRIEAGEAAANAALIAAAPELLEALERFAENHLPDCDNLRSAKFPCDCGVSDARAAIAKAKGGAP